MKKKQEMRRKQNPDWWVHSLVRNPKQCQVFPSPEYLVKKGQTFSYCMSQWFFKGLLGVHPRLNKGDLSDLSLDEVLDIAKDALTKVRGVEHAHLSESLRTPCERAYQVLDKVVRNHYRSLERESG